MIESAQAKNGSLIYLKDGKYLASSFDPQKEAEAWWKTCERQAKHARTVFILGLACGYHIEVVQRELPQAKVVVIESDAELIAAYRKDHAETNFEILHEQEWRRFFQHSSVSGGVQGTYAVLLHTTSYNLNKEFFGNAHKFLLARSVEGLFGLLKNRPDLLSELDETKLADLARSGEPVTIRTIAKTMKTTSYLNENRRLWKVLEELIA